jgi:hypothetical protein
MSESEAFERLGREIAEQYVEARGETTEQAVESAIAKLTDDDLIAFALVAMRDGPDGVQTVSQRHIDPVTVAETSHDAETVIETVHGDLVRTFDEEVRER